MVSETLNKIQNDCEFFQDLDICGKEEITPADFTAAMREVEFEGLTGFISFTGNDRLCIPKPNLIYIFVALNFTIFQYRSNGDSVIVGNFTAATNTTFDEEMLIFKTDGGSSITGAAATPPQDYPQSSTAFSSR